VKGELSRARRKAAKADISLEQAAVFVSMNFD
jgi:hypothetical protein